MRRGYLIYALFTVFVLALSQGAHAQHGRGVNDTIRLGAIITEEGDTVSMTYLDEVEILGKLPRRLAKQRAEWDRLRYNVYKVYPYAVIAAQILKDVDVNLAALENDKAGRKKYLKKIEAELNKRFKGELENFSINQGQILVKLINRQTGKNCFGIIKELKGGFSAVVWQSVALLFSNNLRREYDPNVQDKDIEKIVQEIETRNYYNYMYRQQQTTTRR